ncbi:MAG: Gldg family protein [Bacteroidota bacterium]|nr:Gldg family protein [Bacteroidota bacterium]
MKKFFGDKKFKFGLNATTITILIIGLIVLLNIVLYRYSFKKDFTANKTYEISQQTKDILKNLDNSGKKVDMLLFTSANYSNYIDYKQKDLIEQLAQQYDKASSSLTLQRIDIDKNPAIAEKYAVAYPYEIAFTMGDRSKLVGLSDMFSDEGFAGEQSMTSALNYVLNEKPSVLYILQGHKEKNLETDITALKAYMQREGYTIKTHSLTAQGKIPDDASAVIDIGASTEFSATEIGLLKDYLNGGGKALFLMNSYFDQPQISALSDMLKGYGISVNNDIAFDPAANRSVGGSQDIVIPEYQDNPVVAKLKDIKYYFMVVPASRSIDVLPDVKDTTVESLLKTSDESWGETNINDYNNQKAAFDAADKKGPLNVAVVASKTIAPDKEMKIIVSGSDLIISDKFLQITNCQPNMDFVLNSLAELTNNKQLISIRPKPYDQKQLTLPTTTQKVMFIVFVILLPGIVFIIGFIIWLRRRHL